MYADHTSQLYHILDILFAAAFHPFCSIQLLGAFAYYQFRHSLSFADQTADGSCRIPVNHYKRTTQENSLDCLGTVLCCMCRNNGGVDIRKQYLVWQTSQYQRSVSNGECRGTVLYAATDNPYSYYIWQLYKALIEKQKGA